MVRVIYLTASLTIFLICSASYWWFNNKIVVARVGSYEIKKEHVNYLSEINSFLIPEKTDEDFALKRLIKVFTSAQIMKDFGRPITEEMLIEEERRIDKNTLEPETIKKIKSHRWIDRGLYRSVYLMSILSQRLIFSDFFHSNLEIHKETNTKANQLMNELNVHPEKMVSLALKNNFIVFDVAISESQGIYWSQNKATAANYAGAPNPMSVLKSAQKKNKNNSGSLNVDKIKLTPQEIEQTQRWIKEVVQTTPPGQMFKNIVDDNTRWLLLKREPDPEVAQFKLLALEIPKIQFQDWISAIEKKIPVEIFRK